MSYYRTCPYCGAHLDPGEVCDCRGRLVAEIMAMPEPECSLFLGAIRIYQQHTEQCAEKAAQGVGSTKGGGAERIA